jgi:hypothetical protein
MKKFQDTSNPVQSALYKVLDNKVKKIDGISQSPIEKGLKALIALKPL